MPLPHIPEKSGGNDLDETTAPPKALFPKGGDREKMIKEGAHGAETFFMITFCIQKGKFFRLRKKMVLLKIFFTKNLPKKEKKVFEFCPKQK